MTKKVIKARIRHQDYEGYKFDDENGVDQSYDLFSGMEGKHVTITVVEGDENFDANTPLNTPEESRTLSEGEKKAIEHTLLAVVEGEDEEKLICYGCGEEGYEFEGGWKYCPCCKKELGNLEPSGDIEEGQLERVYIAGPYVVHGGGPHDIPRLTQKNVDHAIEVFHHLKREGKHPFVPHLSHYLHIHTSSIEDYGEFWYEYDLTFLERWAQSIFMLDGWQNSKGSRLELQKAKELGLKIYYETEPTAKRQEPSLKKKEQEPDNKDTKEEKGRTMKCKNCGKKVNEEFQHMGPFGEWGCYKEGGK